MTMNDEILKKMLENFQNPEIQGCIKMVEDVIGYRLSATDRQPFLYFHDYVTNPQPQFIAQWRLDPKLEKWYQAFIDGFLSDLQDTFTGVLYHYERLKGLESAVIENIEKYNYRRVLGDTTISIGNTRVLDFEYQAFILAYRRCLDKLARAIAAYFRNDFHSFKDLRKFLEDRKPQQITEPILKIYDKFYPRFEFVLSKGDRKSVRDKISHYEYVPAGVINLSQRGFVLVGGGEELNLDNVSGHIFLSEVIDSHMSDLRMCIREMTYCFVDSLKSTEKK